MDEPTVPVQPTEPVAPIAPLPEPKPKEPINSIDKANDAIDRMEAANIKTEELLVRQESLRASEILGGKADAGQQQQQPKKELSDVDYANSMLDGGMKDGPETK